MVKRLSEQLSDLSVHVKNAEDAASAAEKEAHDKIAARKEQARAAVKTAIERVNQEVKSAGDSAARDWNAVKAKIAADMNALKANVAEVKHEHDAKRAENRAEAFFRCALIVGVGSVDERHPEVQRTADDVARSGVGVNDEGWCCYGRSPRLAAAARH